MVFDTAQILMGLNYLYKQEEYQTEEIYNSISKAHDWLIDKIDNFGRFTSNNFVDDYNPSYYTRIIWPLFESAAILNQTKDATKLERCLDYFRGLQNENLSFKDWSFEPNNPGLTHSIAYTLRGFYEVGKLTERENLVEMVRSTLSKLTQEIQDNSFQIAATYDQDWSGNYSFICAAGNAQLLILYLHLFKEESLDIKLYESLMGPLIKTQRKIRSQKSFGAVPSSIPIWGKYQRFRYTNWTQKFYLDALLELLKLSSNEDLV